MTHVTFGEFWKVWVRLIADPHPMLLAGGPTVGSFFNNINTALVAPMAQGWLDLAARSPIEPAHMETFARWLIGG